MLNAEKYKKEILALTSEDNTFAVSTDAPNVVRDCCGLKCENCIFDYGDDCTCNFPRMNWLLSEYKGPVKLIRLEHELLKWWIGKDYKYIARDSGSGLYAYYKQPPKNDRIWGNVYGDHFSICDFRDLFQFIKWEDEEPTLIEEVLNNCEVEENGFNG